MTKQLGPEAGFEGRMMGGTIQEKADNWRRTNKALEGTGISPMGLNRLIESDEFESLDVLTAARIAYLSDENIRQNTRN